MTKRRGEIWLIDLAPTIGAEMSKARPAVIVGSDLIGILPLKVIVPITSWQPLFVKFPWMVRIDPTTVNGLIKPSSADTFQVRSLSENRFVKLLGAVDGVLMKQLETALTLVLELTP